MKISFPKYNTIPLGLALSICFSFVLLFIRLKLHLRPTYLFLVWNLFLAAIPYGITQVLKHTKWLRSKLGLALGFAGWLMFLPNSPYIITDLVHLRRGRTDLIYIDLLLVFVFAANGLCLGILSLADMKGLLAKTYSKPTLKFLFFAVCLLCGYGIYLGRFLRFNSWDILTKPKFLLKSMFHSLHDPKVWAITLLFGLFFWIAHTTFSKQQFPDSL